MGENIVTELQYLIGVVVALVLGFAIGFERKLRAKEAGIRTHTVVCAGAALIMIVGKFGFEDGTADLSRVAAQIVSGIGFLGAGIIIYRHNEIHGLTTAAGVWATAGVGMACGAGLYVVAIGATIILIASQCLFHLPWRVFNSKHMYELKINFRSYGDEDVKIKEMFEIKHFRQLSIERDGDGTIYHAMLKTDKEYESHKLGKLLEENPYILSIERIDDD